jgi:hypothetical protein
MQRAPSLSPRKRRRQCSPGSPLGTATTHTRLSLVLQQAVPALVGQQEGRPAAGPGSGVRGIVYKSGQVQHANKQWSDAHSTVGQQVH